MDKKFLKRVAVGIMMGGLGTGVPLAGIYFTFDYLNPLPKREKIEESDASTIDDIVEKKPRRKRRSVIEYHPSIKRVRDTEADKHFDLIMAYVETGLKTDNPYRFQKRYSEFLAENQENLELPKEIYGKNHPNQDRYVNYIYASFAYKNFWSLYLSFPKKKDDESKFSADFRTRFIEEITANYQGYLDEVIEKTDCDTETVPVYNAIANFNRILYDHRSEVPLNSREKAKLKEKEKEVCSICDLSCAY